MNTSPSYTTASGTRVEFFRTGRHEEKKEGKISTKEDNQIDRKT